MSLFSDIYNTVARFFRGQEEQTGDASKSVATNRLKLVLMQDRTNLTPKILEQMRSELIDLLSRYVEMDKELLELNFEQEGEQVALMLSIPVIRAKDEDEINAALEEKENESEEMTEEDNKNSSESGSAEINDNKIDEDAIQESDVQNAADSVELSEANDNQLSEDDTNASPNLVSKPEEMNNSSKTEDCQAKKKEIRKE